MHDQAQVIQFAGQCTGRAPEKFGSFSPWIKLDLSDLTTIHDRGEFEEQGGLSDPQLGQSEHHQNHSLVFMKRCHGPDDLSINGEVKIQKESSSFIFQALRSMDRLLMAGAADPEGQRQAPLQYFAEGGCFCKATHETEVDSTLAMRERIMGGSIAHRRQASFHDTGG